MRRPDDLRYTLTKVLVAWCALWVLVYVALGVYALVRLVTS